MSENELTSIPGEDLLKYIERIERLAEERQSYTDDIKSVYDEAKSTGYVPKIIRAIVAKRKKDRAELEEMEALLEMYERAISRS